MKTILVPTDFSKSANNALNYALAIAKREKAKIILMHAYDIIYLSENAPLEYYAEGLEATKDAAQKMLDTLVARIEKLRVKYEAINLQGLPVDSVISLAKKKKVDFVIMGTRGASGLKEVLLGSNTAKVIAKAPCPVIAIPEKATFKGIKKIAYASNYRSSDVITIKQLLVLAKIFKSRIRLVHITNGEYTLAYEKEYMKNFVDKIKERTKYNHITAELLESSDVEKMLEKYIKKESIDLLAVSTKHRNFLERIFGTSITKALAYHSKVPLVTFHYKHKSVVFV